VFTGPSHPGPSMPTVVGDRRDGLLYLGYSMCVPHCTGCYKPQPPDRKVVVPLYDDNRSFFDVH
jgi:hypothetical protein